MSGSIEIFLFGAPTCAFFSLDRPPSSEIRLGLLFIALKQQILAHFLRVEPNPLEVESFILNRKLNVRLPDFFLLSDSNV